MLAAAVASSGLLWPRPVWAAVTLDPNDPIGSGFRMDGTESFTPGNVLTLTDNNVGGSVTLFANDNDAAPNLEIDVVATFQVKSPIPNNADADNRLVINDGLERSANRLVHRQEHRARHRALLVGPRVRSELPFDPGGIPRADSIRS